MRGKNKRKLLLTIRVSSDEKLLIEKNAMACGMDTADYLRRLGMGGKSLDAVTYFNKFQQENYLLHDK